ncbi:hypothetical protein [Nannocystis exedens]|uniref:hypothetical protein n=1 Tax=Nannocystis exedens TaxID=54 RepID=UPI000BBA0B6B|nr:hypothetical protein [Nannocystis exedens]
MRTIEMHSIQPSGPAGMRPAGAARPTEASVPSPDGRTLIVLADGRCLDAQGDERQGVLYVRAADTLETQRASPNVAPPIAVHPSRPLVLTGRESGWSLPEKGSPQTWRGSEVQVIDHDSGRQLERFPLQPPFVWLDDERFLSRSMGFYHGRRALDPSFAEHHLPISSLFNDDEADGVAEVHAFTGRAELRVRCGVYGRWSRLEHLAVRGDVAVYGGFLEVGAARLPTWEVLWSHQMGTGGLGYQMRALAVSPDGGHVAVGAGGKDGLRDLTVFEVDGGREVLCLPLGRMLGGAGLLTTKTTEVTCLAWHPRGWLAVGTRAGLVVHMHLSGAIQVYRGAARAIEALAFTRDGASLLVASKAAIARFPLLDAER